MATALGPAGLVAALALLAGCGAPRPVDRDGRACVSWKEQIAPLFQARCAACHEGPLAQGGFDVSSYTSVIGGWDRPAWAQAGDPASRLLLALQPSGSAPHPPAAQDAYDQVRSWVVDCRLSYLRSQVHGGGLMNPADDQQFHGALLRDTGWRFASCAPCHGPDLAGGKTGGACLTCHPAGVTTCGTCHGRRMGGAHLGHVLGRTQGRPLDCSECHRSVKDYRDPGHLYEADGGPRASPVQVRFGALASATPAGATRFAPPLFQAERRTCDYVYCHGGVSGDGAATNPSPAWVADPAQAACGTCHGLPPQGVHHDALPAGVRRRCLLCHNRTVKGEGGGALVAGGGGLHLNGRAELGDGSGQCTACHGGPAGPAPPGDLARRAEGSAVGVGAHQSHLQALHRLRGPVPCGDCHLVPQRVDSPGHLDDDLPAEVFPPAAGFASLAQADGAQPAWDHQAARCAGVYCHGGGKKLAKDLTPGLLRAPLWTAPGQAACGTCHGVPPRDADHAADLRLIDCARCHPSSIDPSGTILVSGPPGLESSTHINGVVDVR